MIYYILFKREMESFVCSWDIYILAAIFLMLSGYFFYTDLNLFMLMDSKNLSEGLWCPFFNDIKYILFIMIPLLTMRVFAEEKRIGTIEVLLTFPLKDYEIVIGKLGACLAIFTILLSLTLPYPIVIGFMQHIDFIPVAIGYLGLFLVGCSFISMGIFISSTTDNNIVSAFITFILIIFFWFIASNDSLNEDALTNLLMRISIFEHFFSFILGAIETKNIIFNLLFTTFFFYLTLKSLEIRKWWGTE